MLSTTGGITETAALERLWAHEVFRVYYDRLVFDEDRQWVTKFVNETLKKHFDTNYNTLFRHLDFNGDGNHNLPVVTAVTACCKKTDSMQRPLYCTLVC